MKVKGERKRLIFLGLHRKPIKSLKWDLLCSRRPQVPSWCGENAEHFLKRVLEARAGKWTQRASALQGISLKRERERERERENDKGRLSLGGTGSAALFSKGAFIPWVTHFQKWKMQSPAESAQHSISLTFIKTRMFSAYLSTYKGLVLCTLPSGPEACWHFVTLFW